jgi:hypothetical protein
MSTIKIRLFLGEQDGAVYELPKDARRLDAPTDLDYADPPLHIWTLTVLGERELAEYDGREPAGRREQLTTCAYRYSDDTTDIDGEVLELHYERDVSADRQSCDLD